MNCPNCGAPMRFEGGLESLSCDYCRSLYFPEKNEDGVRILAESSELECPVCAVPLSEAVMDRHRIYYCGRCRGSLIPMTSFALVIEELRAKQGEAAAIPHPPDPKGLRRRILCPRCRRPMDTHYYAGPGNIIIDDCSSCGLDWLDAGELIGIVRAPDHSIPQERDY